MINIALIDDHIVVRSGFAQLLSLEPDMRVVGQYAFAASAWSSLLSLQLDMAVLDIDMPDKSGLSLLARLRHKRPDFRAIILSIYDTSAFVHSALDAGARGYLTKRCGPEELVQALRAVHAGGTYLCADAMRALRHQPRRPDVLQMLTPREKEIFDLLVAGVSVKAIAEQRALSHKTVHVHRANVLGKLQCGSTIELVHFALHHQLITAMGVLRRGGLMLFLALFYGLCWLALWTISFYLNDNGQQAALLLPQGLRLALLLLLSRRYWPVIVGMEMALLFWLHTQQLQTEWIILTSAWVSLIPAWLMQRQWHRYTLYWQRLLLLLMAMSLNCVLQMALPGIGLPAPLTHTLLATLTGGVLLIPFIYLIYEYLKQQHLQHLLAQPLSDPPLRTSLLVRCSLFFSLAVGIQLSLSPDVERLLLIGLAATEYAHKEAAGTVTGFLGLFAYLGAALAGWPLAQWMTLYGWSGFFALLTLAAACVELLLMPLMMAGTTKATLYPSRGPNASGPP